MWTWRALLCLSLITGLSLASLGCSQGTGERCQLDSDCDDGLRCYTGMSQSVPPEGECQPVDYLPDASVQDDAAVSEDGAAQEDGAPESDGATRDDAGSDDATASDGPPDVILPADGPTDSGTPDA